MVWIVVVVVSFVWVSKSGERETSIENCVPRCARFAPVTLTFDGRERLDIFAGSYRLENHSRSKLLFESVRDLCWLYTHFCTDSIIIRRNKSSKDFTESTATPRRGTTLTLTLVHIETHHATTEENSFRNRIAAIVYIVIFQTRAWSARCFYTPFLCRNKHRMILYLAIFSNIVNWRSAVFSLSPAFFSQVPDISAACLCNLLRATWRNIDQSLNGCVCDNTTKTRELCEDERIENNRTWNVVQRSKSRDWSIVYTAVSFT